MSFDEWSWGWEEEIILPTNIGEGLERLTFHDNGGRGDGDSPVDVLPKYAKWNLDEPTSSGKRRNGDTEDEDRLETEPDKLCEPPKDGLTIVDILPWEDILVARILPYLDIKDLFQLRQVSTGFRDIVAIHFSKSHRIDLSKVGPDFTVEAFQVMSRHATNLSILKVPRCKNWINDGLLLPVIEVNGNLREIDISENSSLSTEVVRTISVSCRELRSLSLAECQQVSSTSVESIAMNCDQLDRLDVTGCWNMDDETINMVLQLHPNLKWLSVARAYGITDMVIAAICSFCPRMEYLDVQGCWRITDDAIRKLWNMKSLKTLQVKDCRYITERSLARFRAKGVQVDVLLPEENDLAKLERHLRAMARVQNVPPNFLF